MDQQKLRSLVFEKTGIKIDTSDPVFAVVAMNEALLEEAVQRHLLVLEQSSQAILQQLHALRALHSPQAAGESAPVIGVQDDIWEASVAGSAVAETDAKAAQANSAPGLSKVANATANVTSNPATLNPPASNSSTAPLAPSAAPIQAQLRVAAMTALMTVALMLPTLGMFGPRQSSPAASLTPQQQNQLRQAEKLQKLLPSLDAKTRAQIEAELQKP